MNSRDKAVVRQEIAAALNRLTAGLLGEMTAETMLLRFSNNLFREADQAVAPTIKKGKK